MIYVLAGTQIATLIAGVFICAWLIDRTERESVRQVQNLGINNELMLQMTNAYTTSIKELIDKAFEEREQLLTRITAPDIAVSMAPGFRSSGGVSYVTSEDEGAPPADAEPDDPRYERAPIAEPVQPVSSVTFAEENDNNGNA